jgi:hypothetical protein
MRWRALIAVVLTGAGISLAAGCAAANPGGQSYRNGYNFGVGIDQHGSPNVQADSPDQFCNAALATADPGAGSDEAYPTSDGTKVPRNVPPVLDEAADSAWIAGCVAGLTSE